MDNNRVVIVLFLTAILIFWLIKAAHGDFNHSIGPLAICTTDMEDARAYAESCYRRCTRDKEPANHGYVMLYTDTSPSGGPVVIRCNKVRIEQTFTETWSFSQVHSEPIRILTGMTEQECRDAIQSLCPMKDCNIKAPNNLEGEYHYASDTKVVKDYIEVISLPSGIDYLESVPRVTPGLSDQSFPVSDGKAQHGNYFFIWDKNYDSKNCPFSQAQTHGCDRYNKPSDLINCRKSRFVIPSVSTDIPLKGACNGIMKSSNGLLYKWEDKSSGTSSGVKRIAITPSENAGAHVDLLRVQVNDALNVLDEDLCQTQCELLDLMLRNDRKREVLTRVGGSYIVISKTGYIRRCHPAIGCKLIKPHQFCGNPNRVAISCQGHIYLWNPQKGYLEQSTECNRHVDNSKLVFTVGSHEYSVDDDLQVELPDKEHFGISHDLMAAAGDAISKEIVNPQEIRQSWLSHISRDSAVSVTPVKENKNVTTWEPSFGLNFHWFSDFGRIMKDISSRISFWVTLMLTLSALYIGASIWSKAKGTRSRQTQHQRIPLDETAATWI